MTNKAKPIFTLRVGAEVYLLGTKPWVIKACNFKTGKFAYFGLSGQLFRYRPAI